MSPDQHASIHIPEPRLRSRRRRWGALAAVVAIGIGGAAATTSVATAQSAQAAPKVTTMNGWTLTVPAPASVAPGQKLSLSVTVQAAAARSGIVDVEVWTADPANPRTWKQSTQKVWYGADFAAGVAKTFVATWDVPANEPVGVHYLKAGVFQPEWQGLFLYEPDAGQFSVTTSAPPTTATPVTTVPATTQPPATTAAPTTTRPATTTTRPATTTTRPATTIPATTQPPATTAAPTTTRPAPPTTPPGDHPAAGDDVPGDSAGHHAADDPDRNAVHGDVRFPERVRVTVRVGGRRLRRQQGRPVVGPHRVLPVDRHAAVHER